jgi:LacI family transcriptional regulator
MASSNIRSSSNIYYLLLTHLFLASQTEIVLIRVPHKGIEFPLFRHRIALMQSKEIPSVALFLPAELHYSREALHGVFKYVKSHRPWNYITGEIGGPRWRFPKEAKLPGVLGMLADTPFVRRMMREGIPCVNISERVEGVGTARVLPDNVEVGRLAARYFLDKKFTNFAFTGFDKLAFSRMRFRGFKDALREAGYSCYELHFGTGKWPVDSMDPLPEIGDWLKTLPYPCAVFTHADDHARRVLNECRRLKIQVPEEIAVLGCDDDEINCELSPIPISSIALPLRRLGYEAASMLELLLEGREPESFTVRLPPAGVVSRRSTDIIAVKDPIVARAVSFIAANACKPISVLDVVKFCGSSRRYLERRFATLLGRTPKQEIQRVRIGMAKRLLSQTMLLIPEVAVACGFSDTKMLGTAFSREVGMTPSDYRRSTRSKLRDDTK